MQPLAMWGVRVGLALTIVGVVLVILGSKALDGATQRKQQALFASVVSSAAEFAQQETSSSQEFASSATFGFAMDAPTYSSVYLFNLTNGQELLRGNAQPVLQQIGPYVYAKRSRKVNVTFQNTPFYPATSTRDSWIANSYGSVSYQIETSYAFAPERSNGLESDVVIGLNASYARELAKLRHLGYSENMIMAEFAQQHMQAYDQHLRQQFIADTKRRAWRHYLPDLVTQALREALVPVIQRQRQRVDSASVPANLVRMYALVRTEMIPQVLGDIHKDIADSFLPDILQQALTNASIQALPRVLSNAYTRLRVESVPLMLQRQLTRQQRRHVPLSLSSLALHLQRIAFPYVLQEVYDRSCLETVPFMLRTIKDEIVARDIADNRVSSMDAQNNVIELWRLQGSTPTNFDAWIDDAPTGRPRTGFELLPNSSSLQLSNEVATLLLGCRSTNILFSLVDYDTTVAASYPLDIPTTTPNGFAIWKQVIAMNETAIAYVLDGVNNDVANTDDFLTRAQLLVVRQYLITWAQNDIMKRDRERFWREHFAKRSTNSDESDPDVDLDIERIGIQTGFSVAITGPSTSGITSTIAMQLWNSTNNFSFVSPQGFMLWQRAIATSSTAADVQALVAGVTGATTAQISEVMLWIERMLNDGFITRRALRHWSEGTCLTVLGVARSSCLIYDLEPGITGVQAGFEMNPTSDPDAVVSQQLRELVWDPTESASFLVPTNLTADTQYGYGLWDTAITTGNMTSLINVIRQSTTTPTTAQVNATAAWLANWATNELNALHTFNWWRVSTCLNRQVLNSTMQSSAITTAATCAAVYTETTLTSGLTATNDESPFWVHEQTLQVSETDCDWDPANQVFTKNVSSYQLGVRVYSCDVLSTSLSDDEDEQTKGFELMSLVSDASARISLAASIALWDSSNAFSFLDLTGYRRWANNAWDDINALVALINAKITAVCSTITGGGEFSGIFNATLIEDPCGSFTLDHFYDVQNWIIGQAATDSKWIDNALIDQWRRGSADTPMDLEPYRDGMQSGWELATGCNSSCSLSNQNGTVYAIPREASQLWIASSTNASFVSTRGYSLWQTLAAAKLALNTTAEVKSKQQIATACGELTWLPWMQHVFDWLEQWKLNEHLRRDVLGHWIYAQCPSQPTELSIDPRSETATSSLQTTCPNVTYSVMVNVSVKELQLSASRPTSFFNADIAEESALVQPTAIVNANETRIKCDVISHQSVNVTTSFREGVFQYQACNLLSILSTTDAIDPSDTSSLLAPSWLAAQPTFELNASTHVDLSMDIAMSLWNISSAWSFTNATPFSDLWYPAITRNAELHSLESSLNAAFSPTFPTDLSLVQTYLAAWESSQTAATRVAQAWLRYTEPYLDLDSQTDGAQLGFELFTCAQWIYITSGLVNMPSLDQALYLWNADNTFSILRHDTSETTDDGLPVGFYAWREMYAGTDYSSEQLVNTYPLQAKTSKMTSMQYTLSEGDRAVLLSTMMNATTLSEVQIRGLAVWLMLWSENDVLSGSVLSQWATGETKRGQSDANFNLATVLPRLYNYSSVDILMEKQQGDYFTISAAPIFANVLTKSLRSLWNVSMPGSVINPTTSIIWCAIAVAGAMCPYLVDDFGAINASSLESYQTAVYAVNPNAAISASSNFTRVSLTYLQTQFGLDIDAILDIATWMRQLPAESLFFQINQLQVWLKPSTSQSIDPLRLAFNLGFIFPWNTSVARNASSGDLVSNTVLLHPNDTTRVDLTSCNISMDVIATLWNSSDSMSFLTSDGIDQWQQLMTHKMNEAEFVTLIANSSGSELKTVVNNRNISTTDLSCTLQAVSQWLLSWQDHPFLREFVEWCWIYRLANASESSAFASFLANASDDLQSFPLPKPPVPTSSVNLTRWSIVARIMLDADENASFVHQQQGLPTWEALLVDCQSSNFSSGTCKRAADPTEGLATASVAQRVLASSIQQRALSLIPSLFSSSSKEVLASVTGMIQTRITPWMVGWLDNALLQRFVLNHVEQQQLAGCSETGQVSTWVDVAMIQFINASISRVNYTTTISNNGDEGVESERYQQQELVFKPTSGDIVTQNSSFLPGFAEFRAFCELNSRDVVFAYDATTMCSMDQQYTLGLDDAYALLDVFGDATPWYWNDTTLLTTTRTALLLEAFLSQPFNSMEACRFRMVNIALAFTLTNSQSQAACVQAQSASEVYLQLPMLTDAHVAQQPAAFRSDLQAYLRYAATKFVYEAQVLMLPPSTPVASNIQIKPQGQREYPLGGYITATSVSEMLTSVLWLENNSLDQNLTFQIPLERDPTLFAQESRIIGELLAIDNSTQLTVWGSSVKLEDVGVTDGSQFTTALFTSYTAMPPDALQFYWPYHRRLVEFAYAGNTTRYGIFLHRYTLPTWLAPASLASGMADSADRVPAPLGLLNVSTLHDGLPLAMSMLSNASVDLTALGSIVSTSVVDIEPLTGSVFNRRLVWQLNTRVKPQQQDAWHANVSSCWLPVLWVSELSSVSAAEAGSFLAVLKPGPFAKEKLALWGVIGGAAYVVAGLAMAYISWHRGSRLLQAQRAQRVMPEASSSSPSAPQPPAKATQSLVMQTDGVHAQEQRAPTLV